jgi:hypothetical protein
VSSTDEAIPAVSEDTAAIVAWMDELDRLPLTLREAVIEAPPIATAASSRLPS